MKAIVTKYHGHTNHKPARMSATDMDGNRVMVSYDHNISSDHNHTEVAVRLCTKMGWKGVLAMGTIKGACVHVFIDAEHVDLYNRSNPKRSL